MDTSMKVYGIPNCTTVKKARAWLDERALEYVFVDFRKTPPDRALLRRWVERFGRDKVLNRRGTTWRGLDAATQDGVTDDASAIDVMLAHPSVIKRPVVEHDGGALIGFEPDDYAALARPRPSRGR